MGLDELVDEALDAARMVMVMVAVVPVRVPFLGVGVVDVGMLVVVPVVATPVAMIVAGVGMRVCLGAVGTVLVDAARGVRTMWVRMVVPVIVGRLSGRRGWMGMVVRPFVMATGPVVIVVVGVGLAPAVGRSGHSSLPAVVRIRR
jgi:hypothetical protein